MFSKTYFHIGCFGHETLESSYKPCGFELYMLMLELYLGNSKWLYQPEPICPQFSTYHSEFISIKLFTSPKLVAIAFGLVHSCMFS